VVAGLISAGSCVIAQQDSTIKVTPKSPRASARPSVRIKNTSPVRIRPLTPPSTTPAPSTAAPAVKLVPNAIPAVAKPDSQVIAPGDIVSDVILVVDGKVMNAGAIELIRGQQVMIWLRDLEKLGWGSISAEAGGQMSLAGKNVKLTFKKNQDTAMVNSLAVKLPISTYMRDGKFMVPLSFVSKSLGHEYDCSYRPVAFVVTDTVPQNNPTAAQPKISVGNTLQGIVLFSNKPVSGVKVRAVDKDLMEIEGARATTDAEGKFTISNLPDGEYAAYVYTGDNPDFFNRATEVAALSGNQVFKLKPLALGRILSGVTPASGETATAVNGEIECSWAALDGIAEYRVSVKSLDGTEVAPQVRTKDSKAAIRADKLAAGTKYILEVTAYDPNGEFAGGTPGAGGKPWTFIYSDK